MGGKKINCEGFRYYHIKEKHRSDQTETSVERSAVERSEIGLKGPLSLQEN